MLSSVQVVSGVVRIVKDMNESIEGAHIIIVEDIVDSGLTLAYLLDLLGRRNPASVRVCSAAAPGATGTAISIGTTLRRSLLVDAGQAALRIARAVSPPRPGLPA